ncbi:MAG TPA: hypothetical protein VHE81_03495 [Lacipirellulaceae bacterium]|nr:hypothetical protein [Lacipirellulaceae bacterium]
MRQTWSHFVWVASLAAAIANARAANAQIWKHFIPTSHSSSASDNPSASRTSQSASAAGRADVRSVSYTNEGKPGLPASGGGEFALTQESGPWLIMAASFSGSGAEKQAYDLARELRDRFHLHVYVDEMSFKFNDDANGSRSGAYGSPVRRHYRRGDEEREIAVLVGDLRAIDGPDAKEMLNQVKTLHPNTLNVNADQTTQSMAQVRQWEDAVLEKLGKPRKRGPMAQAFFTRNPLLPREYFVPKGVDAFVAKMNDGVENCLLDCPGRQTIRVATFRGKSMLQTTSDDDPTIRSFFSLHKKDEKNPLVEAAENAHLLTKELRAHGFEAYEFHNRTESIVTIGSFDQTTQRLPDGRVVAIPEVQRIIQMFDASFDTPADPLTGIGNDSRTQRRVEEEEQRLRLTMSTNQAQIVPGMNPKHVKILKGHGKNVTVERIIPMDVHPQVIDVPRRSVSSAYAG